MCGAGVTYSPPMRIARRHAGIRALRVAAGLAVAALLVVGCSTTRPPVGADGKVDNGASLPAPGVTASDISIGYQVGDISALRKRIGFKGVDYGSYDTLVKGLDAVVAYVNANGGLGGRTLKPVLSSQGSAYSDDALFKQFTQDSPVFAAVLTGAFQNSTRPCYQAARTIMLDLTAIAHDQGEFDQFAPYLWAPDAPELGAFVRAQVQSLATRGWFGTKGVAIVAPDAVVSRRVVNDVVVPELTKVGVTRTTQAFIDASNIGTLGQSTANALTSARSQGVDRIFVVGGARILGIMISDVAASGLHVNYAMSTFDLPSFVVDNPTFIVDGVTQGMAGLGYAPGEDQRLSTDVFPDPSRGNEVLCKRIVDDAGANPPQPYRENYQAVFGYCDATLMLKAALDKVPRGTVTPNAFRDAVWTLGESVQNALPAHTLWRAGRFAGASVARPLAYQPACVLPDRPELGCFRYDGAPVPLT